MPVSTWKVCTAPRYENSNPYRFELRVPLITGNKSLFHVLKAIIIIMLLTDSTETATPLQDTRWSNLNTSIPRQIQIRPKSQYESVSQDTEESEFLFGDVAFSMETVIAVRRPQSLDWKRTQ